ncbi:MAG TPA: hypothetical protein VK913_12550, partial [Erythrobacter sp.]|nr:hypothetical protein [Erythrobacter sp.]
MRVLFTNLRAVDLTVRRKNPPSGARTANKCNSGRQKAGMISTMDKLSISLTRAIAIGSLAAGGVLWLSAPVAAQGDGLAMLGTLTKGEWTIKERGGVPDRKICLRSGAELIQLKHRGNGCNQFVVEDGAARVTVQYTCQGNGYGRTSIRRETG